MMKKGRLVAISYVLGMGGILLTTFFSPVKAMEYADAKAGIYSAVTLNDYEVRARFDEGAIKEMQAKAGPSSLLNLK
jgi:hypothetical protein